MAWLLAVGLTGVGAFGLWPLVEYGIHGGLSHLWRSPVAPFHWEHHAHPGRVFTSPLAWVPIAALLYVILALALGAFLGGWLALGLVAGFLRYEWIHYRIHFRAPRTERERRRRAHHLAHHFRNPRAYFGVSTAFWDRVFGSVPASAEQDYARVADWPPLAGRSNFGSLWPSVPRSR
jgi:sterol desaturase/sphingolipid hydroxylase (fatty acid hydroxylase superfamily)